MSASTPPGTSQLSPDVAVTLPRTALSRRPRRRAMPAWWLFSIVLHSLLFASLLLFTSVGQDLLDRVRDRSAIPDVNSDRLEEISEHLQELNELELQSRLAELQEIQMSLEEIRNETYQEFSEFASGQVENTPDVVAQAQKDALESQKQSSSEQQQSSQAQDRAADAAKRASATKDAGVQQQTKDAQQQSRDAQDRTKQQQGNAENAMEKAVRAMGWVNAKAPQEAQQKALDAQVAAKAAQAKAEQAQDHARNGAEEAERARQRLNEEEKRLQDAMQKQAKDEQQRRQQARDDRTRELQQRLDETTQRQDEARKTQAAANEAQKQANAAHDEAIKAMAKWLKETGQLNPPAMPETAKTQPLTWQEMQQFDAYELYRRAVETETAVAETYKSIRAAELGMLRKMPLEEALRNTDVAKPIRPDMDREALTKAARTAEALENHKTAMKEALGEADKMVELARSMQDAALSMGQSGTEGLSVQVAHASAMEKAAAENPNQKAVDLTALMRAGSGGGSGADIKTRLGGAGGHGMVDRSKVHPPLENNTPGVLPGRMIASGGQEANWMYVDSWYIIGPWPNPSRVNIDKKFPPETVVDLDATYVGRDGRPLRWGYMKSPKAMIVPRDDCEYSIYYAYAEVFCEQPQDVWVAIGSDDKSKIWINDQVIWESVPWHKSWSINEGFRKIHLQKGRNRILYRLENGWHSCALSLILCTLEGQ